jgi:uncharacterized protein (DUF58 family)
MTVPQPRLILVAGLVLVPFGALLGAAPPVSTIAAGVIGLFVLGAIVDALRARSRVTGLRVILPPLVRGQKDQPAKIEVTLDRDAEGEADVRLAFAIPDELGASREFERVRLSGSSGRFTVPWALLPQKRGSFRIQRAFLEYSSPFQFWAVRTSCDVDCEVRIYPDLQQDRKTVSALFLRRNDAGAHSQNFSGQGRDFDKLRPYHPGDSLSAIHWKATAKRRALVSKVFEIERTHEVYVLVDASRLSGRQLPSGTNLPASDPAVAADEFSGPEDSEVAANPRTVLERYVAAALILGRAAELQGDRFGLLTFSDRVLSFVRARSGQAHFDAVRERLYDLQPQIVSPDFEELFSFVRLRLRKRALLIVLTNLDDPVLAESFVKASDLVSRQHLLLVNMIKRPGVHPLFEKPERVQQAGDLYRELAGHLAWRRLRELEKVLKRRGVRFSLTEEETLVSALIKQHAEVRKRLLV